ERWDGKGYPRGLKGEAIPLAARIFSVVDTFDAMTSDRPYRRALLVDEAVSEILAAGGTQLDPDIAEAFAELCRERTGAWPIARNHDLAATGRFDTEWFNPVAAEAITWTESVLDPDARALLTKLEPRQDAAEGLLVHGSVVDPAAEYVLNFDAARASFNAAEFARCFFGHTHLPTIFVEEGGRIDGFALRDGNPVSLAANGSKRFMLNPGSVG